MAKTWRQKFESPAEPQIVVLEKPMIGSPAGSRLLISTPREFEGLIKAIPVGTSHTLREIRAELAQKHGVDSTCPLTSGIFVRIVAEVAWEDHLEGKGFDEITPFRRAVRPNDPTAKKLRCGPEFIAERRTEEGITS
jgi:hypothetical protein